MPKEREEKGDAYCTPTLVAPTHQRPPTSTAPTSEQYCSASVVCTALTLILQCQPRSLSTSSSATSGQPTHQLASCQYIWATSCANWSPLPPAQRHNLADLAELTELAKHERVNRQAAANNAAPYGTPDKFGRLDDADDDYTLGVINNCSC